MLRKDNIGKPVMAIFFFLLIISSYATRLLVFTLFWWIYDGFNHADIAKFRMIFIEKVEDVSVILLCLCFLFYRFYSCGLINDVYLWKAGGYNCSCCYR
jgi:hypothetical protein